MASATYGKFVPNVDLQYAVWIVSWIRQRPAFIINLIYFVLTKFINMTCIGNRYTSVEINFIDLRTTTFLNTSYKYNWKNICDICRFSSTIIMCRFLWFQIYHKCHIVKKSIYIIWPLINIICKLHVVGIKRFRVKTLYYAKIILKVLTLWVSRMFVSV